MAALLRGDIYWADFEPVLGHEQGGRRSISIISRTVFNDRSGAVIALALTGVEARGSFPLTLELRNTILPKRTWAKISQIRTIPTLQLGRTQETHRGPE